MKNTLTQNELVKATGLKQSQVDYLVKNEIIPCIRKGSGCKRIFQIEVIEIIKNWQNK